MAYNSSDVSAGDDILASQYNNLRADLTEIRDASKNLLVASTLKLYLDGGGDTYISESAANVISIYTGGTEAIYIDTANVEIRSTRNLIINATKALYLDGGVGTYIIESSADVLDVYVGGLNLLNLVESGATSLVRVNNADLAVNSAKKIYLDNGGDTYIQESAADDVEIFVGGVSLLNLVEAGANNLVRINNADACVNATKRFYLDNGSDTYITESSANTIQFYTAGLLAFTITNNEDIAIEAGKKIYLDSGYNTYLYEATGDHIQFYTGGLVTLTVTDAALGLYASGTILFQVTSGYVIPTGDGAMHLGQSSAADFGNVYYHNLVQDCGEAKKEDIVLYDESKIDPIKLPSPKTYKRITSTETEFGLIAEDCPEEVMTQDDQGNHMINTNALITYMIGVIKKLDARLKILEGK